MEEFSKRAQQFSFQWLGFSSIVSIVTLLIRTALTPIRFFAGQMHVFRPGTDLARVLLALSPLVGAALIAISRLEDYRHDVYDVTVGSILGILVAYFSYSRYYPSLKSTDCHQPYPSRVDVATRTGSGKRNDEESRIGRRDYLGESMQDELERMPLQQSSRDRERIASASDTQN